MLSAHTHTRAVIERWAVAMMLYVASSNPCVLTYTVGLGQFVSSLERYKLSTPFARVLLRLHHIHPSLQSHTQFLHLQEHGHHRRLIILLRSFWQGTVF